MCHRLWQGDCICKQVINRLKIPQGVSTLLFHRWSEVPPRGGVRGDSHEEKRQLYEDATCRSLWSCDFADITAFFSLVFVALLLLSLHILAFVAFSFSF